MNVRASVFADGSTKVKGMIQTQERGGGVTINVDIGDDCVLFLDEVSANMIRTAITKVLVNMNRNRAKGKTVSNYKVEG